MRRKQCEMTATPNASLPYAVNSFHTCPCVRISVQVDDPATAYRPLGGFPSSTGLPVGVGCLSWSAPYPCACDGASTVPFASCSSSGFSRDWLAVSSQYGCFQSRVRSAVHHLVRSRIMRRPMICECPSQYQRLASSSWYSRGDANLHQPNDDDDAKVHARSNLHGALPRHLARRRPPIHLGTCLRPLEGIRAVVHGPEPAAAIRVLHEADALAVAGVVEAAPLIVEEIVESRGGDEALEEQGGEDAGDDGLEALEEDGGEALEGRVVEGREGAGVRVAQQVGVDVGVDEGGDGEDDGEDGDEGREGKGEVRRVEVDDAVCWQSRFVC